MTEILSSCGEHNTCMVSKIEEHVVSSTPLSIPWNLYYHLSDSKNWTVSSYIPIMTDIDTIEKTIAITDALTDNIIKYAMLFIMRKGITPMWEDPKNRTGGAFSYKVFNKFVPEVWRQLMFLLLGETIVVNHAHMQLINGITISPKKHFCIVKIWLSDCTLQNPNVITPIPLLITNGALFRKHEPEF